MKNNDEQVETLWVKTGGQANKGNLVVGVYYRPSDQGEPVDEAFMLQLWGAGSDSAEVLQAPSHLLEKQHSKL